MPLWSGNLSYYAHFGHRTQEYDQYDDYIRVEVNIRSLRDCIAPYFISLTGQTIHMTSRQLTFSLCLMRGLLVSAWKKEYRGKIKLCVHGVSNPRRPAYGPGV